MGANASLPLESRAADEGGRGRGGDGTLPRHSSLYARSSDAVAAAPRSAAGLLMRAAAAAAPDDRKKKTSKLSTWRKRLTRVRRHSRSHDNGRAVRELTATWTVRELYALSDEYDASVALKELTALADAARPRANSIVDDLAALYQHKYCTDVDLIYQGTVFPAHRAVLCIRCPYFRELLARHPEYGARVPVTVRTSGVDVSLFSSLLRYVYTGDFGLDEARMAGLRKLLSALAHEFGAPNSLEQDLRTLLDTGAYSDAVLVFSSSSSLSSSPAADAAQSAEPAPAADAAAAAAATASVTRRPRGELRCHKAILAARSPFFRNLVARRARSGEEMTERTLNTPTCIVLDEQVIRRRYARALLTAVYLDVVDPACILRSSVSLGTLSEVQAAVASRTHLTVSDEAMELYHIGRFLDFPALAHGCEDIIAEAVTIDTLPKVLQWSSKPYGSVWVHRQALQFLREEFAQLIQPTHLHVLYELSREYLLDAVSSDFLQACELDVLTAVIKWGEYQLVKRLEEREPNLLSHTAHSISRKGVKKRDLNDVELRDILCDLLPHIRTDHVLPTDGDALTNAIKRGLLSVPPSHMIGSDAIAVGGRSSASAWVRTRNVALFIKPRLFVPYFDEVKSLIKEQSSRGQDNSVQLCRMPSCAIPDALYMLDERTCPLQLHHHQLLQQQQQQRHNCQLQLRRSASSSAIDIIAGTIPVPDGEVMESMRVREAELSHSKLVQHAYSLLCADRLAIARQIRLRVVREFGLPDATAEVLQSTAAMAADYRRSGSVPACRDVAVAAVAAGAGAAPPCRLLHSSSSGGGGAGALAGLSSCRRWHQQVLVQSSPVIHHQCPAAAANAAAAAAAAAAAVEAAGRHSPLVLAPAAAAAAAVNCPPFELVAESGDASGGGSPDVTLMRNAMPDIAMASAAVVRMSVQSDDSAEDDAASNQPLPDLDLDLGDGASHSVSNNNSLSTTYVHR